MPPATACCARPPMPGKRCCVAATRWAGSAARNSWWSARTPPWNRRWWSRNGCARRPPRCASTTSTRPCGSPPASAWRNPSAPATPTKACWRAPMRRCIGPSSAAATASNTDLRSGQRSDRVGVQFAGADPHHLAKVPDEDLAVADLAGPRRTHDRLDHRIDALARHRDLQLDLGQEVDQVFGTAIQLGMAFLAAEALDLGRGDAGDAGFRQRLAHVVQLEWLDHCHHHFHHGVSRSSTRAYRAAPMHTPVRARAFLTAPRDLHRQPLRAAMRMLATPAGEFR